MLGFAVPATAAADTRKSAESEVVRLTNDARARHGCPAVRQENRLATAARRHSADMARNNFFSHTGSDGSDFSTRAKRAGYHHAMSENIAKGHPSAAAVVKGWLGSAPHRRAILDCAAKAVGVGVARAGDGALLWTQDFGRV
ncbi:CAP domain-containing protein [Micromonospora sp. CPCC 205371]|nr:CAP domain-containing protein [Micromonospora sp. CPCC 205371]